MSPPALRWVATELPLGSYSSSSSGRREQGGGPGGAGVGGGAVPGAEAGAGAGGGGGGGAGPFTCGTCGRSFSRNDSLAHHKNVHTGQTRCPVCRTLFTRKYTMKCHLFTAHGIKD